MSPDDTKRVSFYSFKGGSGRSTGLCNVAYALADRGANVGIIDFDIEAAGLNYVLEIPGDVLDGKKRVQHWLIDDRDVGRFGNLVIDFDEIVPRNRPWEGDIDGELYFIPASAEAELTSEVSEVEGLFPVIADLYDRFEEYADLDYLLLDSRSGISNLAIPTLAHADEIAVFFRYSNQHKNGTERMVRWLNRNMAPFGQPDIFAVPSSVPVGATITDPTLPGRNKTQEITEALVSEWVEDHIGDGIRGHCIVPENDLLKISEQIITSEAHGEFDSPAGQRYTELARQLET